MRSAQRRARRRPAARSRRRRRGRPRAHRGRDPRRDRRGAHGSASPAGRRTRAPPRRGRRVQLRLAAGLRHRRAKRTGERAPGRSPRRARHPPRPGAPPRGGCARAVGSSTGPSSVRTDDTASRFWVSVPVLSVTIRSTAPSVSSAFRRRTSTPRFSSRYDPEPEDDGEEDGRLLGDRRDRRRDAGQDVLAERVAAQEPDPAREDDEPDRDDEEDPDEPVELALQRRSPPLARRQPAGDPPELGRPPDGDDDALATAADDARAGVGDRVAARERRVGRVGLDAPVLRAAIRRSGRSDRGGGGRRG